jgi:hypothetical protein
LKKPARTQVFIAAVQQKNCQHGKWQREQQAFQKKQKIKKRAGDIIMAEAHSDDGKQAAYHKNDKITYKKSLAPAVDPGHYSGEPKPYQA